MLAALRCAPAPGSPGSFYSDASQPPRKPGELIRAEPMKPAPNGAKVWRILYASTDPDGRPIDVSGVVIAPDLPPPIAGRYVLAWAHATTGVADACAPSVSPEFLDTIPHVPALVALDWVVVATDYPGLGTPGVHPYLVGESEGRAILDAVRAAAQVEKSGAGKRFGVWGHSQGGHAALFAGELAASYAPELQLSGIAAIAPATDLGQLLQDDLSTHAGAILTSYSLWTWSRFYGVSIETAATPQAIRVIDGIAGDCIETRDEIYRVGFDSARAARAVPRRGRHGARPVEAAARAKPARARAHPGAGLRRAGRPGPDRPPLGHRGLRGRAVQAGEPRAIRAPRGRGPHARRARVRVERDRVAEGSIRGHEAAERLSAVLGREDGKTGDGGRKAGGGRISSC
jgi:hypothetical protein